MSDWWAGRSEKRRRAAERRLEAAVEEAVLTKRYRHNVSDEYARVLLGPLPADDDVDLVIKAVKISARDGLNTSYVYSQLKFGERGKDYPLRW